MFLFMLRLIDEKTLTRIRQSLAPQKEAEKAQRRRRRK